MRTESEIKEMIHRIGNNPNLIGAGEKKALEWVLDVEGSAMCEANSNAVLDDVVKLLTEYTQYLYKFGYLDDDWIMEASSPIQEFINKKFGNVA